MVVIVHFDAFIVPPDTQQLCRFPLILDSSRTLEQLGSAALVYASPMKQFFHSTDKSARLSLWVPKIVLCR